MRTRRHSLIIAGAGSVSPLGADMAEMQASLLSGSSALRRQAVEIGDERHDFLVGSAIEPRRPARVGEASWRQLERGSRLAVTAAVEAWEDAPDRELDKARIGIVLGCGIAGSGTLELAYRTLFEHRSSRVPALTIPKAMPSAAASAIADALDITGPSFTVSSACSSGLHALAVGKWMLDADVVDRVLVGAVEASLGAGPLAAWRALRVLSPDTMRPFGRERRGINVAEGAAMFVVDRQDAREGIRLEAVRVSTNGGHLTRPDPSAMTGIIEATLSDAGLSAGDIDYVNAHGTGTRANDDAEDAALFAVFRHASDRPTIGATKSLHGHLLAAAGALEFAVALSALRSRRCHLGLGGDPDPAMLMSYDRPGREDVVRTAMTNSFGFGGMNGCAIISKGTQ